MSFKTALKCLDCNRILTYDTAFNSIFHTIAHHDFNNMCPICGQTYNGMTFDKRSSGKGFAIIKIKVTSRGLFRQPHREIVETLEQE